jgi:hypothetical protein
MEPPSPAKGGSPSVDGSLSPQMVPRDDGGPNPIGPLGLRGCGGGYGDCDLRREGRRQFRSRFFIKRSLRITWVYEPGKPPSPESPGGTPTPETPVSLSLRIENIGTLGCDDLDIVRLQTMHTSPRWARWRVHPVAEASHPTRTFPGQATGRESPADWAELPRGRWIRFDVATISDVSETVTLHRENDDRPGGIPFADGLDIRAQFELGRSGARGRITVMRRYIIKFNRGKRPEIKWVVRDGHRREVRSIVWGWCDWRRWTRRKRCDCENHEAMYAEREGVRARYA